MEEENASFISRFQAAVFLSSHFYFNLFYFHSLWIAKKKQRLLEGDRTFLFTLFPYNFTHLLSCISQMRGETQSQLRKPEWKQRQVPRRKHNEHIQMQTYLKKENALYFGFSKTMLLLQIARRFKAKMKFAVGSLCKRGLLLRVTVLPAIDENNLGNCTVSVKVHFQPLATTIFKL